VKISYGDDPSQYGELKLPRGEGPFPVAVFFHGGFWRMKYDRKTTWFIARNLRKRGWASWNVEYRRIGGTGGWPMTLEDAAAAMDVLSEHSERLDLERVTTIGHSAGGHLSLWAAARHLLPAGAPGANPRVLPTRAVSLAGCSDLRAVQALARGGHSAVHDLLGGRPEDVPQNYAIASPSELAPLGVPTLLVHGDADTTVPVSISEGYLEAAGEECGLAVVAGDGHRSPVLPWSASWRTVVGWL